MSLDLHPKLVLRAEGSGCGLRYVGGAYLSPRLVLGRTVVAVLPDGRYDALVVDARDEGDGTFHLEVTITLGEHKGDVVHVRGPVPGRDELDLLATPATLVVAGGEPSVSLDD